LIDASRSMPDLTVRIKKNADGSGALTAIRRDGTVTWQRQKHTVGPFFALHDLTHYAVETTLGYTDAFYGLVADGWNLTDFGAPWARGPLPAEAGAAELIVGFLDTERASGTRWTADEFNDKTRLYYEQHGVNGACHITDQQLEDIRRCRAELFARWDDVPAGGTLELEFTRANAPTHAAR
jgi:hypothetical protein